MINQTLYDKVISVQLIPQENTTPTVKEQREIAVCNINGWERKGDWMHGYEKFLLDDKLHITTTKSRIWFREGWVKTSLVTKPIFTGKEKIASINSDGSYYRTKEIKQIFYWRVEAAHGPIFKVNTLEDMKKCVRPDGTLYHTGDRIFVKEDKSRWQVKSTYDVQTKETVTVTESIAPYPGVMISCPDSGMKPDITFSINLLPGQNCYRAILRVKNLHLNSIDIRKWNRMIITAGYRTGEKAVFDCPIFTSYIESPNPDGVTVFEGITLGQVQHTLTDSPIEINFNTEQVSIGDLVKECALGISPDLNVRNVMPDSVNETMISVAKQKVFAANGMSLLNWLQTTISSLLLQNFNMQSLVQIYGDQLLIAIINGNNKNIPDLEERVITLNMVSGATFSGPALTVEAPWNPAMRPGRLFYMPPAFISGSRLPNSLDESLYKNDSNLYRCLTMSIQFGSVTTDNKMSLLAIPSQYSSELPDTVPSEVSMEQWDAYMKKEYDTAISKNQQVIINVGTVETPKAEVTTENAKEKTGYKLFDNGTGILTSFNNYTTLTISDIAAMGDCLSSIASYYCAVTLLGPRLATRHKGHNREYTYWVPLDTLSEKAQQHFQSQGIPCYAIWFPLIALCTYQKYMYDEKAEASHNWSKINLENPDFIQAGKNLYIPSFPSSWDAFVTMVKSNKVLLDVYSNAYNDYKEKYPSWCLWWRAFYYYCGGTDELK